MEHALHLLLLLLVTRLFGELSERLGQPASMGAIAAGVAVALFAVESPSPLLANSAKALSSTSPPGSRWPGLFCLRRR